MSRSTPRGKKARRDRVFHISYYEALLQTRAALMRQSGYRVSSVLGNEQAKANAEKLLPGSDAVLIGFSGPYEQRKAILHWLKKQHPEIPVVMLQARASETFAEADAVQFSETPSSWLQALGACIRAGHGQNSATP